MTYGGFGRSGPYQALPVFFFHYMDILSLGDVTLLSCTRQLSVWCILLGAMNIMRWVTCPEYAARDSLSLLVPFIIAEPIRIIIWLHKWKSDRNLRVVSIAGTTSAFPICAEGRLLVKSSILLIG